MSTYEKGTTTTATKNGVTEFQFYDNKQRTKYEKIKLAFYNKSTNEILGRTPINWGKLLLFYTIFYAVLATLFAICMQGLFATLDDRSPAWKLEDSLIGNNPGLGFRPISPNSKEGSLIWYNLTNSTTSYKWVKLLNEFLQPYRKNQTGEPFVNCDFNKAPGKDQVCTTTTQHFGNCTPEKMYGYNTSSPCVFIKLNRLFDWVPKYHQQPVEGMPNDLVTHISNLQHNETQQVWVSCHGLNDFDKENVKEFKYFPHGFASYYYPYTNVPHYLSPLVAVEIIGLTPNVIVGIECRAWAQNIEYRNSSLDRAGSVTFEVLVDAPVPSR